jgi:hypothetical protein
MDEQVCWVLQLKVINQTKYIVKLFFFSFKQEVLRGRAEFFESFLQNADGFICSLLPGISHPQVQYSPGTFLFLFSFPFIVKAVQLNQSR